MISKATVFAVFLILAVSSCVFTDTPTSVHNDVRSVIKVIDGDTLLLSPKETVRLIGVNTPETKDPKKPVECFGPEASEFTKMMAEGKTVRLELDEANARRGHKDVWGRRTLGYVYLEDGTLLNAEIIRQGYGRLYTKSRFRYLNEFRVLERQASETGVGLWSACPEKDYFSWLSKNLSASMAAMQPVPAAVTAWR